MRTTSLCRTYGFLERAQKWARELDAELGTDKTNALVLKLEEAERLCEEIAVSPEYESLE